MSIRIPVVGEKRVVVKGMMAYSCAFSDFSKYPVTVSTPFPKGYPKIVNVIGVDKPIVLQRERTVAFSNGDWVFITTAAEWNRCTRAIEGGER